MTRLGTPEERDIVLPIPFGWYVVDYAEDLAVGQVKPLRYFAKDLVLWRGEDGTARLLDAYCRHLGAHLGYGGAVEGNDVVCPFHAWKYDGSGAVTGIPYAKVVPPQARRENCVRSWPVVERNRLIWVWYHPFAEAPLWEVAEIPQTNDPEWTAYDRHEWQVHAHLQDMAENGVDTAHFRYIHGTATFPEMDTILEGFEQRSVVTAKLDTPRGQIDGAITSTAIGPGQAWTRFTGICDTLLVPGITPIERDLIHVRFNFTQPRSQADGRGARVAEAIIRDVCKQLEQDKVVWDRKAYVAEPLLCDGDGPIMRWRQFYRQFYAELAAPAPERLRRTA